MAPMALLMKPRLQSLNVEIELGDQHGRSWNTESKHTNEGQRAPALTFRSSFSSPNSLGLDTIISLLHWVASVVLLCGFFKESEVSLGLLHRNSGTH